MFDDLVAATTGTRGAAAVGAWTRVENAACARRLATMVVMLQDACSVDGSANRDQWCIDNWAAVTAHVGAAQRLTVGTTSNLLLVAMALQERFPKVGALFWEGVIGYTLVRTIVTRAGLVKDPDALRQLDAELAAAVRDWEPMSQHRTGQTVDGFIAVIDPHAVIRTQTHARGRSIEVVIEDGTGMAQVFGTLSPTRPPPSTPAWTRWPTPSAPRIPAPAINAARTPSPPHRTSTAWPAFAVARTAPPPNSPPPTRSWSTS